MVANVTLEMIVEVNDLVLTNHRIIVDEIHQLLGICMGITHTILH